MAGTTIPRDVGPAAPAAPTLTATASQSVALGGESVTNSLSLAGEVGEKVKRRKPWNWDKLGMFLLCEREKSTVFSVNPFWWRERQSWFCWEVWKWMCFFVFWGGGVILERIKAFWWQPCHQQSSGSVVLDDHGGFSSAHDSDPTVFKDCPPSVSHRYPNLNPNLHYLHFFRQKTGRFSPESRLFFCNWVAKKATTKSWSCHFGP